MQVQSEGSTCRCAWFKDGSTPRGSASAEPRLASSELLSSRSMFFGLEYCYKPIEKRLVADNNIPIATSQAKGRLDGKHVLVGKGVELASKLK